VINLNNGWSWISLNVELDDMSITSILHNDNLDISLVNNDHVKDQYDFTSYYEGYGFFGQLVNFNTDVMFAVQLVGGSGATWTVTGQPATLPRTVTLNRGWTYISCPYPTAMPMTAMPQSISGGFTGYVNGDQVKSFTDFTDYYEGYGWFGQLINLEPGVGYMLDTSAGGAAKYEVVSVAGRRQLQDKSLMLDKTFSPKQPKGALPAAWSVDAARFATTMTVTAVVSVGGVEQGVGALAAFVGSEVRGVQDTAMIPPFGPFAGKPIYSLVVRADKAGETLSFRYFDGHTESSMDKTLTYAVDGQEGNAIKPLALRAKLFG